MTTDSHDPSIRDLLAHSTELTERSEALQIDADRLSRQLRQLLLEKVPQVPRPGLDVPLAGSRWTRTALATAPDIVRLMAL